MKRSLFLLGAVFVFLGIAGLFMRSRSIQIKPSPSPSNAIYLGKVLAGKSAPYMTFDLVGYDLSNKSGKYVLLYFNSSWCQVCQRESAAIKAGFNQLTTDKLVGYELPFSDDKSSPFSQQLAQDLKVSSEHTIVILKNGREVFRTTEVWDQAKFAAEIGRMVHLKNE